MDTYEASDPRLSGEMAKTGTDYWYPDSQMLVFASSVVLDNEAERWVGTANGFYERSIGRAVAVTMDGEGAYGPLHPSGCYLDNVDYCAIHSRLHGPAERRGPCRRRP